MASLIHQRCFNHATREAVARCPSCQHYFCRECITEHEDRVICAACLVQLKSTPLLQRPLFQRTFQASQMALGILIVWIFFYLFGQSLISLPNSFHETTLWRELWIESS